MSFLYFVNFVIYIFFSKGITTCLIAGYKEVGLECILEECSCGTLYVPVCIPSQEKFWMKP